jgi:glycosyltransferase involved in cell wall biosynthesis
MKLLNNNKELENRKVSQKILIVTKRHSINKDLIKEEFGAPINIFKHLSAKHDITILAWDKRKHENFDLTLHKIRIKVRSFSEFIKEMKKLGADLSFDRVIAMMDPLASFLGYFFTKNKEKRFIYFMQDNYEAYPESKIPCFKHINKRIIKKSYKVICVSESLAKSITRKAYIIENGIDVRLFKKTDKRKARKLLGLPLKDILIIYTGGITEHIDAKTLFNAFNIIKRKIHNAKLLLVGESSINLSGLKGVIYRKAVEHEKIPLYLSSADILIMPHKRDNFHKYSFPAKLPEYLSVDVPIVASAIDSVKNIFERKNINEALCTLEDENDMAEKIIKNIGKKVDYRSMALEYSWERLAEKLNLILNDI